MGGVGVGGGGRAVSFCSDIAHSNLITHRFRLEGSGLRVQGLGLRVQGLRFRIEGSGLRV